LHIQAQTGRQARPGYDLLPPVEERKTGHGGGKHSFAISIDGGARRGCGMAIEVRNGIALPSRRIEIGAGGSRVFLRFSLS
jgi:hypothetical protein